MSGRRTTYMAPTGVMPILCVALDGKIKAKMALISRKMNLLNI